jgi:transcriptional regulator with XRE-family HTH domain
MAILRRDAHLTEGLMTFGELLRTFRTQAQLSQRAMAQASGIDQAVISRFEAGDRGPSGPAQVEALIAALRLNDHDASALLGSAGYWPRMYVELGPDDRTLRAVVRLLTNPKIPTLQKERFRQVIAQLVEQWTEP